MTGNGKRVQCRNLRARLMDDRALSGEWARHLDDVMLRRTGWHYYQKDSSAVAAQTAEWMQEILAWDDTTREAELKRFRQATN